MAHSKWEELEARHGRPMKDILIKAFEEHGDAENPQGAVAAALHVSQPTISLWIKALGLRRKVSLLESARRSAAAASDAQLALPL